MSVVFDSDFFNDVNVAIRDEIGKSIYLRAWLGPVDLKFINLCGAPDSQNLSGIM